jgi:hypothetical protein
MSIRGSYRQVLSVCRQVRGLLLWPVWRSFQALAVEFIVSAKHMCGLSYIVADSRQIIWRHHFCCTTVL